MTWNWYRHSNNTGKVIFSQSRNDHVGLEGNIRTRPATEEEIAELEEKYG